MLIKDDIFYRYYMSKNKEYIRGEVIKYFIVIFLKIY